MLEEYPERNIKPEMGKLRLNFVGKFQSVNMDLEAIYEESGVKVIC